jgi:hypothetical protein
MFMPATMTNGAATQNAGQLRLSHDGRDSAGGGGTRGTRGTRGFGAAVGAGGLSSRSGDTAPQNSHVTIVSPGLGCSFAPQSGH